jgi:hypothetical protein
VFFNRYAARRLVRHQFLACKELAVREGYTVVEIYTDIAQSGASLMRIRIRRLLARMWQLAMAANTLTDGRSEAPEFHKVRQCPSTWCRRPRAEPPA